MADFPRCRSCWAVLRFVVMASGKRMPVEPVRDPKGIVAARKVGRDYIDGVVLRGGETPPAGFTTFRPHWADCEHAKRAQKGETEAPRPLDRQADFLF
jgi:hypothetical protein